MIFKVESFTVRVVNVEGKTLYINELLFFYALSYWARKIQSG